MDLIHLLTIGAALLSPALAAAQAQTQTQTQQASHEKAHAVNVDTGALPRLGSEWRETNPYRGNPQAAEIGRLVYEQACARCHGAQAGGDGGAPDLRRIDGTCRRIADTTLRARCQADVDDFFRRSVLYGKLKVGILHMPPWQGFLSQEEVWAARTYIETRPR